MTPVILLFIAGVVLICTEFFIPGIVVGLTGVACVALSIGLGWHRYPEYGVFILIGEMVGVGLVIGLCLYLVSRTRLGKHFVMSARQDASQGYSNYTQDPELKGKLAAVHTALRPAGSILLDGQRIDAVSNGTFIDAGKTVRIILVEGSRVVCEEAEQPAS